MEKKKSSAQNADSLTSTKFDLPDFVKDTEAFWRKYYLTHTLFLRQECLNLPFMKKATTYGIYLRDLQWIAFIDHMIEEKYG